MASALRSITPRHAARVYFVSRRTAHDSSENAMIFGNSAPLYAGGPAAMKLGVRKAKCACVPRGPAPSNRGTRFAEPPAQVTTLSRP